STSAFLFVWLFSVPRLFVSLRHCVPCFRHLTTVMSAIDIMVESLKRIILDASTEKLKVPMILPIESMEGITE
ncbi:MAG: hypothetical protein SOW29_02660, partial [Candidatus Faecousia sp.]|nr:hypothetical protein [Candidatus Faecousia sp.]